MRNKYYIEGENPGQCSLIPLNIDDMISQDNAIRFIGAFIDSLDLQKLGFLRSTAAVTGRPGYAPGILLKLYVYGHTNRIRSSRMLERECVRNIECMWLMEKLTPDHNTISDFRKDNKAAIKKVFQLFVTMSVEMGLIKGQQVCIDGTPIKAVNGMHQATSLELSRKKAAYFKAQLELTEKYLSDLDEADKLDQGRLNKPFALDVDPEHLPDVERLKERIRFHEHEIELMQANNQTQILYTDPEARVMPAKQNGKKACYNIQTAVDADAHMIVAFDTTNDANDLNKLCSTAKLAMENLNQTSLSVIADKGYESAKDIESCLMNGIIPDVGFTSDREYRVFNLDYAQADITAEIKHSNKAEDIQKCLHAGVLPDCYEHSNISIEVQEQSETSCFIRHEDGTVTCPMGKVLGFQGKKKNGTVYGSKEACRTCPNRCTDGRTFKTVKFGDETHYVPVIMYGSAKIPLQKIPDIQQPMHYNAFGKVKRKQKRVVIFIMRDKAKQRLRMEVSEHPFGTIKHYDN
ncbi:MAG: transposase, partial [Clostridia bacterium]